MKLVKIEHERCDEYDKTTYYVAPDYLNEEEIQTIVKEAQEAYLVARQALADSVPMPKLMQFHELADDMTIGEFKKNQKEHSDASTRRSLLVKAEKNSFETYLKKKGILALHEVKDAIKCVVGWGHKHGQELKY